MDIEGRLFKLLRVAEYIASPKGATIDDLRSKLNVKSRTTIYGMIEDLQKNGFIYSSEERDENNRVIYRIDPEFLADFKIRIARDILFNQDDARFLSFLLESAGQSSPLLGTGGDLFLNRLSLLLGQNRLLLDTKKIDKGNYFKLGENYYTVLLDLLEAVEEHKKCRITYESVWNGINEYDIYPIKCFTFSGGVYVLQSNNKGKLYINSVGRIQSIEIDDVSCEFPNYNKEEASRILTDPFSMYSGEEEFTAVIRLDAEQGWYEEQKAWPDNVSIQRDGDDYLFKVTTKGNYWLVKWILSLGRSAQVLEPSWLKVEVKEELEAMLERYRDDK